MNHVEGHKHVWVAIEIPRRMAKTHKTCQGCGMVRLKTKYDVEKEKQDDGK